MKLKTIAGSIPCIVLLVLVSYVKPASLLHSLSQQEKNKLDAPLNLLLHDFYLIEDPLYSFITMREGEIFIPILVKATMDISELVHSLGGFVGSHRGYIYTVYAPPEVLIELTRKDFIDYIEAAKRLKPELDTSLPYNGTTFIHNIPPYGFRGKGVIIGITDSGLDLTHPDFTDSLGNTRVLYLWDQYNSGDGPPPGFVYGSEYTREQLIQGNSNEQDYNGHGTRVAGIAAGNGQAGEYVGMAPEADLIIVKTLGGMLGNILDEDLNTAGLLDAYAYIRMRSQELGKPFVINTSRGTTIGPHDGSTLLGQAVNAEVAAGATIVVSAGNYSNNAWHAEATAQPGVPITFNVDVGPEETSIYLDFWYETEDLFQIEIAAPAFDFLNGISGDTTVSLYEDYGRIYIVSKVHSPLNEDNEFLVRLANPLSGGHIISGVWQFRFTTVAGNQLPDGGEIDGWIIRDVDAQFLNYVDPTETIGELASSDSVISVAAYNNKSMPIGQIALFSSIGPRRDGVLKPDLAAAGGGIVSSRSQQSEANPYGGNPYYAYGSGTSYSAPHVAGTVALLLEQSPNLSSGQIKSVLWQTAQPDEFTGLLPNVTWGYGKLDVIALLISYIPSVTVSGDVRYQDTAIPAMLNIKPFGVNYPELEYWFNLTTDALLFSTTMFAGKYTVGLIPILPFETRRDSLLIPIDTGDYNHSFNTNIADVLVIDDESSNYETHFLSVLDSLHLSYSYWPDSINSIPPLTSAASLMSHPVTIWFTGDEEDSVLTVAERDTLQSFLQWGGGVLLTGQNILESIDSSEFALQYLQCRFAGNTQDHLLHGVASDPVFGEFPYLFTSGIRGAGNQTSSDILEIIGTSRNEPIFYYDTVAATIAGVRTRDEFEDGRLIFLGFGVEAVTSPQNNPDFMSREQLLAQAINWLASFPLVSVWDDGSQPDRSLSFRLQQNYPNPFNTVTVIQFDLTRPSTVELIVYDLLGQKVATIANRNMNAGSYTFMWDGMDNRGEPVASGVYLYKLGSGNQVQTRKLLLLR